MKSFVLVSFLLVFFANPGWCGIVIDDTNAGFLDGKDVGAIDTWLATTTKPPMPNSSTAAETAWVNSVLSPTTTTFVVKDEPVVYYSTDRPGVFAFSLPASEEYFVVKNSDYWALFRNNIDLAFGVFDSSFLPNDMNLPTDPYIISHVSQFDSGSTNVPEPMSLLVFGSGLAGLVGIARIRRREEN